MLPALKSKKIWLGIAVFTLLLLGAWGYKQTQGKQGEVITVQPQVRDLSQTLEVNGSVQAKQAVDLRFAGSSKLTWVGVKQGDWVNQWQTIASVDTATLQKQLRQDLNNFEKRFRDHDQVLDDIDYYNAGDINREIRRILEKSQFDLNNSVIDVEIRSLAIRLSSLSSPIQGIVTRIDTPFAGVTISPSDTFQIVNPSSVYFDIVVDEEDISLIKLEQPVTVTLDAYPDESLTSNISAIGFTAITSDTGGTGYTIEIGLPVDNTGLKYKLGMNGVAEVVLEQKSQVLSLPAETIINRDDKVFVRRLANGVEEEVEVELGLEDEEFVEIVSGISASDQIILPRSE